MKLDKFLQSLLLTSAIAVLIVTPAKGEEVGEDIREANKNIPQLDDIELPATSAQMLVQTPTPTSPPNPEQRNEKQVVPIAGVKANATSQGVEIILQTR